MYDFEEHSNNSIKMNNSMTIATTKAKPSDERKAEFLLRVAIFLVLCAIALSFCYWDSITLGLRVNFEILRRRIIENSPMSVVLVFNAISRIPSQIDQRWRDAKEKLELFSNQIKRRLSRLRSGQHQGEHIEMAQIRPVNPCIAQHQIYLQIPGLFAPEEPEDFSDSAQD